MGTERNDVAAAVRAVPNGDACHVARPGRRHRQGDALAAKLHFLDVPLTAAVLGVAAP